MKWGLGRLSLNDLTGGVLASGSVPYTRLVRSTASGANAALVTLVSGFDTLVLNITTGDAIAGDLVLVEMRILATKTLAAGGVRVQVSENGTATLAWVDSLGDHEWTRQSNLAVNDVFTQSAFLRAVATVGGTISINMVGRCFLGQADVAAGDGQVRVWIIRGS